jgi:hypothetical protein
MNLGKSHEHQLSIIWKASLLLMLVSGLLIAADRLSMRYGLDGSQRMLDDFLGGLIAGSAFYLYERRRQRRLCEHLHVIDLINHHIRNALQLLMFLKYKPEERTQMELVGECVHRIDWALREVLPGRSKEQFVFFDGGEFVPATDPKFTCQSPDASENNKFRDGVHHETVQPHLAVRKVNSAAC